MSIDVMKQALEALVWEAEGWEDVPPITRDAITALRAAIEQAKEPVAWEFKHRDDAEWKRLIPRAGQTLEAALAELRGYMGVFRRGPLYEVRPLYTAPRQWQGLTEAEIDAVMPVADGSSETDAIPVEVSPGIWGKEYDEVDAWSRPLVIELARAIEAKLKEKNNGLS